MLKSSKQVIPIFLFLCGLIFICNPLFSFSINDYSMINDVIQSEDSKTQMICIKHMKNYILILKNFKSEFYLN